jgi:hypothetical protein
LHWQIIRQFFGSNVMNNKLVVQQAQGVIEPLIAERVDEFHDERTGILRLSRHGASHPRRIIARRTLPITEHVIGRYGATRYVPGTFTTL